MHCSIVNHFNQKTTEKPVYRRSLVVLDIDCTKNNIMKELGVSKDGQTVGYSFLPPKKSNQHPNLLGLQRIFKKSVGLLVTKNILNLKRY